MQPQHDAPSRYSELRCLPVKSIEVINSFFYPRIPRYCLIRRVKNWARVAGIELAGPNRLLSLPLQLGGPSPARTAHDYQYEPDYEQCREGRVVEQTIDCQQRGSHDKEETYDGCDLGERSQKDSEWTSRSE